MKKVLLIFLMAISLNCFTQIKVSETVKPEKVGKVQHFECVKYDSVYVFTYNDYKFTHINEYKSFSLSEEDFHTFYNVIIKGFNSGELEKKRIETESDVLILEYSKSFGVVNLKIFHMVNKDEHIVGLTKNLTIKSVDKLFGK